MKKYLQLSLTSVMVMFGLCFLAPVAQSALAIDVFEGACKGGSSSGSGSDSDSAPGGADGGAQQGSGSGGGGAICGSTDEQAPDIIKTVINAALVILGMIAVVMIVIGGIRYTTSNGDASSIKGAKDTILYAVVGLVVAILSFAIVNFVLGRFSGN